MTGPHEATKGIVAVFDIFGYFDQTIQGADILAASDRHQKYKVFMPDWFNGSPCPAEWYRAAPLKGVTANQAGIRYPPNTEEK